MSSTRIAETTDPSLLYRRHGTEAAEESARLAVQDRRLGGVRIAVFGLLVTSIVLAAMGTWPVWTTLAPGVAFVALLVVHEGVRRRLDRAAQRTVLYERGLARIEDRWAGTGREGREFEPPGHVFAGDLDLFGRGSLFELLCTVRTRAGEECLAGWLLTPAPPEEIRARQAAVEELRPRLDQRERLALVGGEISSALDRDAARAWGEAPAVLSSRALPWIVRGLGLVSAACASAWAFAGTSPLPMVGAFAVLLAVTLPVAGRVGRVLADAERPSQDLALVGRLLRDLEHGGFESPWLQTLEAQLESDGVPPSRHIARLVRRMDFVDARRNQIFLPISWILGLGTQLAYSLERWRSDHGTDLGRWVEAVAAFEAVNALAGYAFEHPQDPFPEILESGTAFEGEVLGHPLLPAEACVANDVSLRVPASGDVSQAMLVSGSNMSGKSTLLRTVGVNTVLAFAGAPVRAQRLALSPVALGASIRIHDSLQAGESRFYAEIARLRKVVDQARGDLPGLFLLDEILHGTNSHDRRIGAAAVVRSLLEVGAIGLVTTHDLALATVAEEDERMRNVHFEDHMVDGRIQFDYRLRPGVVTRSNAIELMRAVGLDV